MRAIKQYAWPAYLTLLFAVASATFVVEGFGHTHAEHASAPTTCHAARATVAIHVTQSGFQPEVISAKMCDKLVFKNDTQGLIEIAFGQHDHHLHYPGLRSEPLKPGTESSVVLVNSGEYLVHDHLNDDRHADLRVE